MRTSAQNVKECILPQNAGREASDDGSLSLKVKTQTDQSFMTCPHLSEVCHEENPCLYPSKPDNICHFDEKSLNLSLNGSPRNALFELNDIVTPVKVDRLDFWLKGYEDREALVSDFTIGMSLGCVEEPDFNDIEMNHKMALEHPEEVDKFLEKELKAGRIAGPYSEKPFDDFHVSPINLREKSVPDTYRFIQNHSFPEGNSVNSGIPKENATVQYESIDQAIEYIQELGQFTYMAKSDVKSAFRICPVRAEDRHLLGMKWKGKYYFDKVLTQGGRMSCKSFERLSTALQWICKNKLGIKFMLHVLDDFCFLSVDEKTCYEDLRKFIELCDDIGVPLAPDKTVWPAMIMTFLGILLNTIRMEASLPEEKIVKCKKEIKSLLNAQVKKVQLRKLQSVIGLLNFCCKVVQPGRAFLRRLIDRTCNVQSKFHRVRVTNDMKLDLKMWLNFISECNSVKFIDTDWILSPDMHLFTDSSKKGFGGTLDTAWFAGEFPVAWKGHNITFHELYPILIAILIFKEKFSGKKVMIHTDNKDLVDVINKKTSREKLIMPFVRKLVLENMLNNTLLHAVHIKGSFNIICDSLSRGKFQLFRKLAPHMDQEPTKIPSHLLPAQILNTCNI